MIYINGSPKLKKSGTNYILNNLTDSMYYLYKDSFKDIAYSLENDKTIVFGFPLYVDSPPNKVIEFMEYIKDNNISIEGKNIYVIVNCGFFEAFQNQMAVDIVENFCINNKAIFKGSFKIGAGAIIGKCGDIKIYKLISIPFFIKIKEFKKAIINEDEINLSTTIRPMGKLLYIMCANKSWKKQMVKNKVIKKIV